MARISAVTRSGRKLSTVQLAEREIIQQVKDFLHTKGWRSVRFQRAVLPGSFQMGEPGQPDYLFLHYLPHAKPKTACLALWIEFKSPADRRTCRCAKIAGTGRRCTVCDQKNWHARERTRGATVWVVDDFSWFAELYEAQFSWLHSGDAAIGQLDLFAGGSR